MKCFVLLTLVMASPLVAEAQTYLEFRWDDCVWGESFIRRDSACDSDAGLPDRLVASVTTYVPIENVIGARGVVDVIVDHATLPDYWRLEPGGCRAGALRVDPLIGSASPPYNCAEPWSQVGNPTASFTHEAPACALNRAAIVWSVDVASSVALDPAIAPDWYLIRIDLSHAGTSACAGCAAPACLFLSEVRFLRPDGAEEGDMVITQPGVSTWVQWQGAGSIPCPYTDGVGGPTPCAVPVLPSTWGQVKSLYR